MNIAEACELIGVVPHQWERWYLTDDIRLLFSVRVKEAHPDTSTIAIGERGNVATQIRELKKARDLLLEALESQKYACKLCRGVGKVRSGMGWRQCGACGGKGETR